MRSLIIFISSFMLLIFFGGSAHAQTDLVDSVQNAYNGIKDVKGSFMQKSYIKELKRTDTYKGLFYIKPPKMRWEYRTEKPQIVYVTGDEIIIHQQKEKQAFISRFNRQTYGQAPIALLGGFGSIKDEFNVVEKKDRLVLKPKKHMNNIASIEIVINQEGFPIKSMLIIDTRSNKIDITLSDVKTNTSLKDSLFEFAAPEGTAVIRH
ncbi:MAG: outer membrane lipoprotein carrier protein LolA [Dissulfurispiraceae bacterium]|nr:outer membrane lipoprotein carrier protein LolA [Dissulfurispiraceae bacterium]